MVVRVRRPWARFERRCSTTWSMGREVWGFESVVVGEVGELVGGWLAALGVEAGGVEGGLGDEAVGEGEAEEEEVPVEAGGFAEGEVGALGYEGGDVVVEVEEDGEEEGEGDGEEDVAHAEVPEGDEPASGLCWVEGFACWEGGEIDGFHAPDVDEAGEEDYG